MSHLVALTAPQSAAHTVKRYPGFGILGADIPATGDNGGSPVLNDGVLPGSEYHWRVVTPPSSGTLTLHPDLSFELSGAADGDWTWQYRLYEDGTDEGVATVSVHVGAYNVAAANSQQANTASAAAIRQTHLLGIASSQQGNQSSTAAIRQTHLIGAANSQQVNTGVAASVSQSSITFVSAADSIQINTADAAAIRQTHLIGVASGQQTNTASAAAILQTAPGSLLVADSQQINAASAAAILQTHLLGIADSQQGNTVSPASVTSGSFTGSLSDADIARIVAALPSASDIAAAVWQRAIENGHTSEQMIRIMFAALAGTSEQAGSTIVFKSADGATSRIIGSFDAANNRVGVILDGH